MKFYNDDKSFAQLSRDSNLFELYDFDRCSGLLSNRCTVTLNSPPVPVRGLSVSPSNRFLYVSSNFNEILQFDLNAADVSATRTVVGTDNGIGDPFAANFYYQEVAPDGKIYISSYDSNHSLSVIHSPDSPGFSCNFQQFDFALDSLSNWFASIPNVPHYSLGKVPGSGCDTLTAVNKHPTSTFIFDVYPNPFSNELQLSVGGLTTKTLVEVSDVWGRMIYSNDIYSSGSFTHQSVDATLFSSGIYTVTLTANNERVVAKLLSNRLAFQAFRLTHDKLCGEFILLRRLTQVRVLSTRR